MTVTDLAANSWVDLETGQARGFHIGDIDVNYVLQLQLFLMLTASYFAA